MCPLRGPHAVEGLLGVTSSQQERSLSVVAMGENASAGSEGRTQDPWLELSAGGAPHPDGKEPPWRREEHLIQSINARHFCCYGNRVQGYDLGCSRVPLFPPP